MRTRRPKHLDERFDWYAPVIESDPTELAGRWAHRWFPDAREVRLDLGCGKGSFTLRSAQAEPDVLFVGADFDRASIAMAAKKALEEGLGNVVFTLLDASDVPTAFGPGEVGRLHLNFSSPFPPAKYASKRLTHVDRLMAYRHVLAPGASVRFKTDSAPLFEFSLAQFRLAGYDVLWQSRDLRADRPDDIMSDYEERLVAQGARVHALEAVAGPAPLSWEQTAELSLAAYLPEDLDELDYIPYGMETTVQNLRNRAANARQRAERQARAAKAAAKRAAKAERARADLAQDVRTGSPTASAAATGTPTAAADETGTPTAPAPDASGRPGVPIADSTDAATPDPTRSAGSR